MQRDARHISFLLLSLSLILFTLSSSSFAQTWSGGSKVNGNWQRRSNWSGDKIPANDGTADLIFGVSSRTGSVVSSTWSIDTLTFNSGASAYSFSGSRLTLMGGLTNNSTAAQTFSNILATGASQSWKTTGQLIFAGVVSNNYSLNLFGSGNVSFTGGLRGSGNFTMNGTGAVDFGPTNTYTGKMYLNSGILSVGSDAQLGPAPTTTVADKINFNGGRLRTTAGITMDSRRGVILGVNGGTIETTVGVLNYAGIIAGSGGLTKMGAGTLNLTGPSTYTGPTIIQGGRLTVNNTTGSGTGTGAVTVNSGGILGGNGRITGTVTLNAGGTIAPGNSPGNLTTGSEIWNGGPTYQIEIQNATGAAGSGWDLITILGSLTVNATSANKFTIDIRSLDLLNNPGNALNFNPNQSYSWQIVQTSGGITFSPGENEDTSFALLFSSFSNPLNGAFSVDVSGNNLNLIYTPVPEPAASQVLVLGLGIRFLVQQTRDGASRRREWRSNNR